MSEHIIEKAFRKDGYKWYTETIEREEIVRCKDCVKWSFFDVEDGVRFGECAEFTAKVDKGCGHATREYGFCAWGEHK